MHKYKLVLFCILLFIFTYLIAENSLAAPAIKPDFVNNSENKIIFSTNDLDESQDVANIKKYKRQLLEDLNSKIKEKSSIRR